MTDQIVLELCSAAVRHLAEQLVANRYPCPSEEETREIAHAVEPKLRELVAGWLKEPHLTFDVIERRAMDVGVSVGCSVLDLTPVARPPQNAALN